MGSLHEPHPLISTSVSTGVDAGHGRSTTGPARCARSSQPGSLYHGTVDEDITSALQRRVSDMEDGAEVVVTAWVAVVEYITADGTQELALINDTDSPEWRLDGLLSGGHSLIGWQETADEWDD